MVLDLGTNRREVLFAVATARWCSDMLEEYSWRAVHSPVMGFRTPEPIVEVDAIINGRVPQVRLRFGRWSCKFYFAPQHAVGLANLMRMAIRKAEREIKWLEERDPAVLLK